MKDDENQYTLPVQGSQLSYPCKANIDERFHSPSEACSPHLWATGRGRVSGYQKLMKGEQALSGRKDIADAAVEKYVTQVSRVLQKYLVC